MYQWASPITELGHCGVHLCTYASEQGAEIVNGPYEHVIGPCALIRLYAYHDLILERMRHTVAGQFDVITALIVTFTSMRGQSLTTC